MTVDEARAILARFGEGIHPGRDMFLAEPTHDDWHHAVATLTGIPYEGPHRHLEHHTAVADLLGLDGPPRHGRVDDPNRGHAQLSTDVMRALTRRATIDAIGAEANTRYSDVLDQLGEL